MYHQLTQQNKQKNRWSIWQTGIIAWIAMVLFAVFFQSALAVTVGPGKMQLRVDPGDVIEGTLYLKNNKDTTKTFYSDIQAFTERDGERVFLETPSLLAEWFEIPKSVELSGNGDKQIPYTLSVPEDAPAGGHFAIIWWSTAPPETEGGQVAITARAGIVVYLNVSGDVEESALVTRFAIEDTLTGSADNTFTIDFKNTGTTYVMPTGTTTITNLWGTKRASLQVNSRELQVLPGSEKTFTMTLANDAFWWGPYKATAKVNYAEGKMLTKERWFFVIPPVFTSTVVFILFVIFFGIPWLLRVYRRRLIASMRREMGTNEEGDDDEEKEEPRDGHSRHRASQTQRGPVRKRKRPHRGQMSDDRKREGRSRGHKRAGEIHEPTPHPREDGENHRAPGSPQRRRPKRED